MVESEHPHSRSPGERNGNDPRIRWGRFVNKELEASFQTERSYSMASMGSICFPLFGLLTIIAGIADFNLIDTDAAKQLLFWRGLTLAALAWAGYYSLKHRKKLSFNAFSALLGGIIATILATNVPISLIYLEEIGRSDRLLQIAVFSLITLTCHPGPLSRLLGLGAWALLTLLGIDTLGGVSSSNTAHDVLSLSIALAVAIGGNQVWCTRNRENYLVTLQLATSEAELRKLRELQAQSAVAALQRRDAQWSAVVGQSPVVVLTVDRTGVIAFANPVANELGFRVGDLLDKTRATIDGRWLRAQVEHVFREAKTRSFDLVLGEQTAETTHWTFYAAPIEQHPRVEQVTLVGLDSTEAWRLRFELRRKSRESSLGGLVTSISHDFNNLLMVIVGSAEMLKYETPPEDAVLVNSILDAANKSDELIRRMLRFVRGAPSRPETHDANALIEDMGSLLRYVSGAHNRFSFDPCNAPTLVRIDKTEFEQILINLCSNANSAIDGSGQIQVRTEVSEDGKVRVIVQDNGCGISEEVKQRMFEPYFTTRAEYGGTGVGLATVRGLVEAAGGTIEVHSAPSQGTQIELVFEPIEADEATAQAPFPSSSQSRLPQTALVVDENSETRQLARSMLERMGCSTYAASSLQSAIEQAQGAGPIDLLITDFRHDLSDAISLDAQVRARNPKVATVYSTGHIDNLEILKTIQQRELVVLQKPYTSTEMANAIDQACTSRRASS